MRYYRQILTIAIAVFTLLAGNAMGNDFFGKIEPGAVFHGFKVENLYLDAKDDAVGARMLHVNTGFTLDLFQIQSVPQTFAWVNSPIYGDMGEPHTCEHLLLGKGNKGRYVASMENMSLGRSTAYTSQIYTAYPFSSPGGNDVFFDITAAKMDAFLHPNFSDEEIRREVCNIGVTVNPSDGTLGLEEKGTIYTEMVSYYEKHWYYLYPEMDIMLYGKNHPMATNSGGAPEAIRKMVPEDMWAFHKETYQLENMGFVSTIPDAIPPDGFLQKMDGILKQVDVRGEHPDIPRRTLELQPPQPTAPPGEIRVVEYPGSNDQEPGQMLFAWPPQLELDSKEMLLLKTFLHCLGGSQTSNLYNKLVNSDTRVRDIGATGVWSSVEDVCGHAISIGVTDVEVDYLNERDLAAVAGLISKEVQAIVAYAAGSSDLEDFNRRANGYLENREKNAKDYLNTPPGFGNRGGGGGRWYRQMKTLEAAEGFRKSLIQKDEMSYARALLEKDENIWAPLIAKWKLAETDLYAVGAKANPEMLTRALEEKKKRLAEFTEGLKKRYGVTDDTEAIAKYKEEYDSRTAVIEEAAAKIPMPDFLENPPSSYDPQLDYRIDTLVGAVPLVTSNFNSMTSTTVGIALNMNVVPADKLIYLPFIPELITEIGVIKDGEIVDYPTMTRRLKNEVLRLKSQFSSNVHTGRMELLVKGAGGNLEESKRALQWMAAGLFQPYLDPANLSRIRDVVDQKISYYRDRMKGSEEYWVYYPANGYLYQTNPLSLAGNCFLTQHHFMHRLKWRLMEAGNEETAIECENAFDIIGSSGRGHTREELTAFAGGFGDSDPAGFESGPFGEIARAYLQSSTETRDIVLEALSDLAGIIGDAPEENAADDWTYLTSQMKNDLLFRPEKALEDLAETLALLRHQKNARMFTISNSADREQVMPSIMELVSGLESEGTPVVPDYPANAIVKSRMLSRYPGLDGSAYVGLVNTNTRNGVFMYSHPCASLVDYDEEQLLDYLAAKLYGGGGAHSMFMKTWGAGLAYSNGLRSSERLGRLDYYAERCPDLSVTMRFVVEELKKAPYDTKLADYAVAQTFAVNRGPNSYESRGEAMASNLADGITPEIVGQFRRDVIALRDKENLYDLLHQRMEEVYGRILIGYGNDLSAYPEGMYFIIGPEAQFEKLEEYIAAQESEQVVYRIYPRDYWITN
jgi:Zn-dependent M16 (insulinase) family peptidase